ncbi:MAG TPA: hypothetical protein VN929_10775 [Burkholderiales bacterium]|nr:hypothetical protein [Burkholderiales bacterium]
MRNTLFCALLAASATAYACGYCVEDKVAAVYDHAVVTRALSAKHVVVFFAIDGALAGGQRTQRSIEDTARAVPGVDAASVRVSVELAALSIAFDPRRTTLAAVEKVLDRRLAPFGLSLLTMKLMDRPGELNARRP